MSANSGVNFITIGVWMRFLFGRRLPVFLTVMWWQSWALIRTRLEKGEMDESGCKLSVVSTRLTRKIYQRPSVEHPIKVVELFFDSWKSVIITQKICCSHFGVWDPPVRFINKYSITIGLAVRNNLSLWSRSHFIRSAYQCGVDCPHKGFTASISSIVRSMETLTDTCLSIGSSLKWTMDYGFNRMVRSLTPLEIRDPAWKVFQSIDFAILNNHLACPIARPFHSRLLSLELL